MHTTASSLVAIAQYFWRIRTSVLYGNQQKFNIEDVNDYPPIRFEIRIVAADSIQDSIRMEISDSQVSTVFVLLWRAIGHGLCMLMDLSWLNVMWNVKFNHKSTNFWLRFP